MAGDCAIRYMAVRKLGVGMCLLVFGGWGACLFASVCVFALMLGFVFVSVFVFRLRLGCTGLGSGLGQTAGV